MKQQAHNSMPYRIVHKGFSLIEVLVSLSLFTVVITISIGVLMVLVAANARAQNTQSIMTNLSFAMDSITREIRTGADFYCGSPASLPVSGNTTQNCANGGDSFSFNEGGKSLTGNASSRRIGIRFNEGVIERRLGNGSWMAMTSPDIKITDLRFYVTGATRADYEAPTVTIFVEGTAGETDGTESTFHVQTTVVQQLLDV
jgi:prepilin-type N-terminal cleavage/methylation domain-containing protein